MNKVSVVIPVYGQWDLAKRNIDALLHYDRDLIKEILVVNDCSPEANPYIFDINLVKVITNEKNLGYAGTVNNGLRRAASEVIVLLDSDAYPIGAFISKVLAIYESDPMIGCVGFGTVDDNGNDSGNFQYEPSLIGYVLGQQVQSKLEKLSLLKSKTLLPNSCAVSFRKACLEEVGYFKGDVFPVLEADVDLNMSIHYSRWKLIFKKNIIICHKGGNSYKVNYKRVLLYHASRWKLLRKHNKINNPALVKATLKGRVLMEILLLKMLRHMDSKNENMFEKIKGRELLLEEVERYN